MCLDPHRVFWLLHHFKTHSEHRVYYLLFVCLCITVFICTVLLGRLSRGQGGGYRASRLCHIEELLFISGWRNQTLMLVTPHYQVDKVIQELLWNVVSGSVLTPKENQ